MRGDAPPSLVALACSQAGQLGAIAGDVDEGLPLLDRSIELLRTVPDPTLDDLFTKAHAVRLKGNALTTLGRYAEAEPCFVEAVARFEALGSDAIVVNSTLELAMIAYGRGDLARAKRHLDGVTTISQTVENMYPPSYYHFLLALVACETGDLSAAAAAMAEVIAIEDESDYPYAGYEALAGTAVVASALEEHEVAARLLGTVEVENERLGIPYPYPQRTAYERVKTTARSMLGDGRFDSVWAEGRRQPLTEAFAAARTFLAAVMARCREYQTGETKSGISGPYGLTRRELEVLREVAAGKSNLESRRRCSSACRRSSVT